MSPDLTTGERTAVESIVGRLEASWNAMDAAGFAAAFASDADFVNIHGEHFQGRPMIAAGHAAIFRTVYVGSTTQFTLETARLLRAKVALLHVHAVLEVPQGPLAGRHGARFSMVLTKQPGIWEIAAFHNTRETGRPPQ